MSAARRSRHRDYSWLRSRARPRRRSRSPELNQELYAAIEKKVRADLTDALDTKKYSKLESYARIDELHEQAVAEAPDEQKAEAGKCFDALKEKHLPR